MHHHLNHMLLASFFMFIYVIFVAHFAHQSGKIALEGGLVDYKSYRFRALETRSGGIPSSHGIDQIGLLRHGYVPGPLHSHSFITLVTPFSTNHDTLLFVDPPPTPLSASTPWYCRDSQITSFMVIS